MKKITGKTQSGFSYSYDQRIMTDWDFITLLGTLTDEGTKETEKITNMQKLLKLILGDEQTNELIEHIRKQNEGYAPIEEVMKELGEITSQKN